METYDFQFFNRVEVPSALDPQRTVNINRGIWPVNFDDTISRKGNGPECEIVEPNVHTTRILRSDLVQLCENGKAKRVD